MKRILFSCLFILFVNFDLFAQNMPPIQIYNSNWVATDALGRELPTPEQAGPPRSGKYVGVFYFLWHGSHNATAIYDITKLLQQNPDNPQYGPHGAFHWWGEPEAGYYRAEDPWVIRRNIQMLVNAGVDFVYFDVTNGFIYLDQVIAFCNISLQMRREGLQTPYVVFCTHTNSGKTINKLYDQFYSLIKYKDLWFIWQGKPLILGDKDDPELFPEAKNFFTFRYSWAWTDTKSHPDQWQWIDHTPQDWGWHTDPNVPEQIPVSVAEHPITNRGASFHNNVEPPLNKYKLTAFTGQGLHFKEQWQRALEVDPEVIMVTGWNEWIAQRMIKGQDGNPDSFLDMRIKNGDTYFVDEYNEEFDRDIEPMKGGHTDNRYYQFVANVRKFKGMSPLQLAYDSTAITIDGKFSDWATVRPVFKDPRGDTFHRNYYRYDKQQIYTNTTGRNDIVESRVAYNSKFIYFYAKTAQDLTPYTDQNWMLLFIDSDRDKSTGWEGYDYLVNLHPSSDSTTTLHTWQDSNWVKTAEINYRYSGCQIEIKIPRMAINQTDTTISLFFHWADNIQKLNDITEFFINGDSAPDRRFNFYFASETSVAQKPPYAPSDLVATAIGSGQIDLKWVDNSINEEHFRVERSDSVMGNWKLIATLDANSQFYSDKAVIASTVYYYRVQAVNKYGRSAYSNIQYAKTLSVEPPAAPSDLRIKTISSTQLELNWTDNSNDEDGFIIYRSVKDTTAWATIDTVPPNYTSYSDNQLEPSTKYYYRIGAFNKTGNSNYSNTASATTKGAVGMIWNFDNNTEGWNVAYDIAGFGWQEGGYIGGRIVGIDPYVYSNNDLNVNINTNKFIRIRMKNNSNSTAAQIYFVTQSSPIWGEANHRDFSIVANDTCYRDYVVDMSTVPSWKGTLMQIRVDPTTNVTSGSFSIDFVEIFSGETVVKNDEKEPLYFQLYQNYPNPFNSETRIRFSIPVNGRVKIEIYNLAGQKVTNLLDENKSVGSYFVLWDGKNENGKPVSSGVYFYRIEIKQNSHSLSQIKKMVLIK